MTTADLAGIQICVCGCVCMYVQYVFYTGLSGFILCSACYTSASKEGIMASETLFRMQTIMSCLPLFSSLIQLPLDILACLMHHLWSCSPLSSPDHIFTILPWLYFPLIVIYSSRGGEMVVNDCCPVPGWRWTPAQRKQIGVEWLATNDQTRSLLTEAFFLLLFLSLSLCLSLGEIKMHAANQPQPPGWD